MSRVEIKPEVEAPRKVTVLLEWFPDQNQMQMSVAGGDSMQYRGMLVKGMTTIEQIETEQVKPNRVQLAPGPLPRQN